MRWSAVRIHSPHNLIAMYGKLCQFKESGVSIGYRVGHMLTWHAVNLGSSPGQGDTYILG